MTRPLQHHFALESPPSFSIMSRWTVLEIAEIVEREYCTLTDDLTISGDMVPREAIWKIKKVLRKHGHYHSVQKERGIHLKPVEITGVILRPEGLRAPNRQHKKLHDLKVQLRATNSEDEKGRLEAHLIGRQSQLGQISSGKSATIIRSEERKP